MKFHLFISRNVFFDDSNNVRKEIHDLIDMIGDKDINVYLVTRSIPKYKRIIDEQLTGKKIEFIMRGQASRKFLKRNYKNIMLIGAVDEDIRIAANNKILLINPLWIKGVQENIEKYGFKLKNIVQVIKCIEILSLDHELFYDFQVDEKTRLIALSNANKYYAVKNEREMIEKYKGTLKYGIETYRYAVYFHYLTMIMGMDDFTDVDYWMSIPSSSGANENNVYDIVKSTRYLLNNRSSDELFIRHSPAQKSTYMKQHERLAQGSTRHLSTIHLNPKYKGKLKGKKVVVIDDYVTYGASFETARNLLIHEGVQEIILLAIGTFRKEYYKETYKLENDLYQPGYDFEIIDKNVIHGKVNEKATKIINDIYEIINN